jgi:hypothetical protein
MPLVFFQPKDPVIALHPYYSFSYAPVFFQPKDPVIALHPHYSFSYAPGFFQPKDPVIALHPHYSFSYEFFLCAIAYKTTILKKSS